MNRKLAMFSFLYEFFSNTVASKIVPKIFNFGKQKNCKNKKHVIEFQKSHI